MGYISLAGYVTRDAIAKKQPGGYIMPIIAMFMTGTLIYSTFVWAPIPGLVAALIAIVTGLPAYYMWERNNKKEAAK